MDQEFEERFKDLKEYSFVKLLKTPNIDDFDPVGYKKDGYLMASLLAKSKILICGQSTLAIDASCTNTPIINLAFEGQEDVPDLLSVRNRYHVNHYQDLLKTEGTRLVSNFDELDNQILNYLDNPIQCSEGRKKIKDKFAGDDKLLSSERIINRLKTILES
jgi:CDP-glycerol glycerophosphotransferase (TagB/SpsB family)